MNILSFFHFAGSHDTGAALVCDGTVIAAAEEERFTRIKHDSAVPLRSIEFCLEQGGLSMTDIDLIAFADLPFRSGRDSVLADIDRSVLWRLYQEGHVPRRGLAHYAALAAARRVGLLKSWSWRMSPVAEAAFEAVRKAHGALPRATFYQHHLAHAATSYFTSGWSRAAICTVDGRGDPYATVTWGAQGSRLRRLRCEPWFNSLGFFYRDCTEYLGLGSFAEGKTMGLSSYADGDELGTEIKNILDTDHERLWYRYRQPPAQEILGFPSRSEQAATAPPYPQFAAAAQRALERALDRTAKSAIADAGSGALCLAGGVALSCAANGKLMTSEGVDSLWVFAASGDGGLSLGAALLAASDAGELSPQRLDHAYLGPEYGESEIASALNAEPRLAVNRPRSVAEEAAERLANGEVIGWFQGRMELGPRALGNRSILADPRTVEIRDRVNDLKGREPWRPLAPTVLAEHADDYFDLRGESPFMLLAAQVRPRTREEAPAIVHVDGSARPQTVRRDQNPLLCDLIEAFERRTGLPMLLNTSFNAAGEPIVCTPADAVRTTLATGLDALVCGDYLATPGSPA